MHDYAGVWPLREGRRETAVEGSCLERPGEKESNQTL